MDAASRIELLGATTPEWAEILTPDALAFVAALAREFETRRRALLAAREERWVALKSGKLPEFLPETAAIRGGDWATQNGREGLLRAQIIDACYQSALEGREIALVSSLSQ